ARTPASTVDPTPPVPSSRPSSWSSGRSGSARSIGGAVSASAAAASLTSPTSGPGTAIGGQPAETVRRGRALDAVHLVPRGQAGPAALEVVGADRGGVGLDPGHQRGQRRGPLGDEGALGVVVGDAPSEH